VATNDPIVPVLRDAKCRGWPTHPQGAVARYTPLAEALSKDFPTDVHFAAYCVASPARRLCRDALRDAQARAHLQHGVTMQLVLFDIDCAASHAEGSAAPDEWWGAERVKVEKLLARHAGAFVYRTRGGYRVLYRLLAPVVLHDDTEAGGWSSRYCLWLAYLRRAFDLHADPSCKDWTRLYRLPHATRDPLLGPERREAIGEPDKIGVWEYVESPLDVALAGQLSGPRRRSASRSAPRAAPIPAGSLTTYGASALRRVVREIEATPVGNRNKALNAAAFSLGRLVAAGHLNAKDVEDALVSAASGNGYLAEAGEGAVRDVIACGLVAGVAEGPRGPTLPWAKRPIPS
jgi:hypothetical protein